MKKINKVLTVILIGTAAFAVSFSSAKALLIKAADNASFTIGTAGSTKDPGYYLIWNEEDEIKLGDKVDTELKTTVTVATTGEQSFKVVDEEGTTVKETEGTITLDMSGTYTFCYRNGEKYSHGPTDYSYVYYSTYLTDNFGWGQSNIKCYLYNGSVNNTWPGNEDYTVAWEKTDEYGKEVYKISINAFRYATNDSKVIFNNNSEQTIDISLSSKITEAGKTAFYTYDGTSVTVSFNSSSLNWWKNDGYGTVAYFYGGSKPAKWISMTEEGSTNIWHLSSNFDRNEYKNIIFVRSKSSGEGTGFPADSPNQTNDLTIPTDCVESTYIVSGSEKSGSWESKKHGIGTYEFTN